MLKFRSFNKRIKDYNVGKLLPNRSLSVDSINPKDSTYFYEEPLFSKPVYYDYYSNINGGLGFFEAYLEKLVLRDDLCEIDDEELF